MAAAVDYSELRLCFSEDIFHELKKKLEGLINIPENVKTSLDRGSYMSINEVKWIHEQLKGDGWRVHELLMSSKIMLPEPVEVPRNPELEARIKKLKLEQENREYRDMTKNVDSVRIYYPEDSISYQLKQINKQLIAVLQFLFSVGAGFTFGFLGVELLVGELEFGFRLLLGVMCSLIIALAEIYFLAKKLAEDFDPLPPQQRMLNKLHQD